MEGFPWQEAGIQRREPVVLIAQDDPELSHLWSSTLRDRGFHVITAHDGESAVSMATAVVPDAALLDVLLPRLNGIEALKRIRENEKTARIKVVIVTDLPIRHGDFETGQADALLNMPVGVESVHRTLVALLG